jgi:DNA-directed RNA polymerase subunit beta'
MTTTVARLIFNSVVPDKYRSDIPDDVPIGSKEVKDILQRVAEEEPDKYKEISFKLLRLGSKGAVETGSSFSMQDLESPIDKSKLMQQISEEETSIFSDSSLSQEDKEQKLVKLYNKYSSKMPEMIFDASLKKGSNLAKMVASGARGNKSQLNSNIGADFLVMDQTNTPVPIGIKSSYTQGMTPAEYFAASYGTRAGLIATKFSTQNSGFLAKQINASAMDLLVTEDDCNTGSGIPVTIEDKDNVGAVLAKGVSGYSAGTLLTPKILKDIQKQGKSKLVVRSAMTCQSSNGICSRCCGVREKGGLPKISDAVGLAAASALTEPLSQSLLSTKHSAGVANAAKVTGFKAINALFQVPETFPDKASLSETDGVVDAVEKLPQGGFNVSIDNKNHYVSPDHEVLVKRGDKIESGDRLSSGMMNPSDVVRLKGIGAGRLSLLRQIQETFKENGIDVSRRNAEIVARAVVDHVNIVDGDETSEYLPDETIEYSSFSKSYVPRQNSYKAAPTKAIGKYLEAPVLHYSIGTRITNSVAKELDDLEEKEVLVSDYEPNFKPTMVRLMENPSHDKDWMSQLGTSYVQKNLKKNVIRGDVTSNIHGTNPLPALAYGKEFGNPPKGVVGY